MKFFIAALFALVLVGCNSGFKRGKLTSPSTLSSQEAMLTWDPSVPTDPNVVVAGYKIYWGFSSGSYIGSSNVGNVLTTTLVGLEPSVIYYFVATAYDQNGNESSFSNEVSKGPPNLLLNSLSPRIFR